MDSYSGTPGNKDSHNAGYLKNALIIRYEEGSFRQRDNVILTGSFAHRRALV